MSGFNFRPWLGLIFAMMLAFPLMVQAAQEPHTREQVTSFLRQIYGGGENEVFRRYEPVQVSFVGASAQEREFMASLLPTFAAATGLEFELIREEKKTNATIVWVKNVPFHAMIPPYKGWMKYPHQTEDVYIQPFYAYEKLKMSRLLHYSVKEKRVIHMIFMFDRWPADHPHFMSPRRYMTTMLLNIVLGNSGFVTNPQSVVYGKLKTLPLIEEALMQAVYSRTDWQDMSPDKKIQRLADSMLLYMKEAR